MHRCRGFQEIRHRERAFQRLAGWMIQHAGNLAQMQASRTATALPRNAPTAVEHAYGSW
jgi:hypothetical protein